MKRLFTLLAIVATTIAGCSKEPPSRWEAAAKSAEAKKETAPATPPPPVVEGGSINKFFPSENVDGKKRKFLSEKPGYVEAAIEDSGKTLATLSVVDLNGKADDLAKFDKATEKLDDAPLLTPTKKQSSILVGKRFQVKVSSDTLTADDRKTWLRKFDLKGLANFKPKD